MYVDFDIVLLAYYIMQRATYEHVTYLIILIDTQYVLLLKAYCYC